MKLTSNDWPLLWLLLALATHAGWWWHGKRSTEKKRIELAAQGCLAGDALALAALLTLFLITPLLSYYFYYSYRGIPSPFWKGD